MPVDHCNYKATGEIELQLENINFFIVGYDPNGAIEEEREFSHNAFLFEV
jgi:hypothetical protein